MRRNLTGVLVLIVLMLVVSTCSGGNSGSSSATNGNTPGTGATTADNGQPKDGGSLIIGVQVDPVVLNPNYAGDRVLSNSRSTKPASTFRWNGSITILAASRIWTL